MGLLRQTAILVNLLMIVALAPSGVVASWGADLAGTLRVEIEPALRRDFDMLIGGLGNEEFGGLYRSFASRLDCGEQFSEASTIAHQRLEPMLRVFGGEHLWGLLELFISFEGLPGGLGAFLDGVTLPRARLMTEVFPASSDLIAGLAGRSFVTAQVVDYGAFVSWIERLGGGEFERGVRGLALASLRLSEGKFLAIVGREGVDGVSEEIEIQGLARFIEHWSKVPLREIVAPAEVETRGTPRAVDSLIQRVLQKKPISLNEARTLLRQIGFTLDRNGKGSHEIWQKETGDRGRSISVILARHGSVVSDGIVETIKDRLVEWLAESGH